MGLSQHGSQPQHVAVDMSTVCALLVGGATERSAESGERQRCIAVVTMATEWVWAENTQWACVTVMRCCQNVQDSIVDCWLRHTVLPPPRLICDSARLNGSAYEMRASEGGSA